LDFNYSLSILHLFTGIIATFLLLEIVWLPEFMLGATEVRIQSSRAREVSGEVFEPKKSEQGKCPVCNQNTTAIQEMTGEISIPCESDDCSGKGVTGSGCEKCGARIPSRVVCTNCGSNTPVGSHFGRVEAW
jgi:DnaJ-class molecular chaperone